MADQPQSRERPPPTQDAVGDGPSRSAVASQDPRLAFVPTSIPDQKEADEAAARLAANPGLLEAVKALEDARRAIEEAEEAPRPAPESDLRVYVPPTTPKIVSGHLTRPRAMLNPRRDLGHKTERALGFSPLVKAGFGEVVNDGKGGVKVGLRWKRVAPIVVVFGGLALVGIYGAAQAVSAPAQGSAAVEVTATARELNTSSASVVQIDPLTTPTASTLPPNVASAPVTTASASPVASAASTPSASVHIPSVKPSARPTATTPTSAPPNPSALLFPTN